MEGPVRMGSDIRIFDAIVADAADVVDVDRESYESPLSEEFYVKHLIVGNRLRVIREKGAVIAYYATRQIESRTRIVRLAVARAYRFQRIGTFLVADLVRCACDDDSAQIFVDVSCWNDAAFVFLGNFGFKMGRLVNGKTAMRFSYVVPTEQQA